MRKILLPTVACVVFALLGLPYRESRAAGMFSVYLPLALRNYPPPPQPEFVSISAGQPVLGETVRITLAAANAAPGVPGFPDAGRGYDNAIVVSIPQGDGMLRPQDVTVLSSTGLTVTTASDRGYLWLYAARPLWNAGETYTLTLEVTPQLSGTYTLLAKAVMHSRSTDGLPYTDPWSGETVTEADVRFVSPPAGAQAVDADGETATLISRNVAAGRFWERINAYRTQAGLPALELRPDLAQGCTAHAQYMLAHDVVTHTEDLQAGDYSPAGDAAAQASLLFGAAETADASVLEAPSADALLLSPFSLAQALNPWLRWSGAAFEADSSGAIRQAGCLDVARGIDYAAAPSWPVAWPGAVTDLPAVEYRPGDVSPDPLSACGYRSPAGTPVLILTGDSAPVPAVTASTFEDVSTGTPLPHCVYTERTYTNPDADAQQTGRAILQASHGIVLLPAAPLQAGHCYRYTVTTSGQVYTNRFCTAASVRVHLPASAVVR